MDTDELSTETYEGVIIEAEKFNHNLTLQFGLIASSCKNKKEYLTEAKKLIQQIKKANKSELMDIFFDDPPDKKQLHLALEKILTNIIRIENIPENKKHYDF